MLSPVLFDRCLIHIFSHVLLVFFSPSISKSKCIFMGRIPRHSKRAESGRIVPAAAPALATDAGLDNGVGL
jgi:hypothetical protein